MKRLSFLLMWLFVLVVVAYDIYFALVHCDAIEHWESNPVAVYLVKNFTIYSAIVFRCFTVLFPLSIFLSGRLNTRWQWICNSSVFAIHVYLCGVYLAIHFGE